MRGTHDTRPLDSYRDEVTELIREGESFGEIEDAIDDVAVLSLDEKAGLWLFAFSLDQQREARAQVRLTSRPASRAAPASSPQRARRGLTALPRQRQRRGFA